MYADSASLKEGRKAVFVLLSNTPDVPISVRSEAIAAMEARYPKAAHKHHDLNLSHSKGYVRNKLLTFF